MWSTILADAGYSSGENYDMLEKRNLRSFIPPHGTYKGGPQGFIYHKGENYFECPQGNKVTYRKTYVDKGTLKHLYLTRKSDCTGCPIKAACIKKSNERQITITANKEQYNRAIARVKSREGRCLKNKRQSTVEPVFGTLINFMGMRKVNTLGIKQASKSMLKAAAAYNLKKYIKYVPVIAEAEAKCANNAASLFIDRILDILSLYIEAEFQLLKPPNKKSIP